LNVRERDLDISNLTTAKLIVYRYSGSASTDEIVFDAKGAMPNDKQGETRARQGATCRQEGCNQETVRAQGSWNFQADDICEAIATECEKGNKLGHGTGTGCDGPASYS
jgi:hypothetical protein